MRPLRPSLALLLLPFLGGGAGAVNMPDLVADQTMAAQTVGLELLAFRPGDCALEPVDQCVDGPGGRKVLRFTMETRNIGTADLVIGDPRFNVIPSWSFLYSPCHTHYHFVGFSNYELHPRGQPGVVAAGHKESFCIEDTHPFAPNPAPQHYGCFDQGLTVGWSDRYDRALDCQWIDVTDVPAGEYDLHINLNPLQLLPEGDYSNNVTVVPVTIPADREPPAIVTVRPVNGGVAVRSGDAVRLRWRRRYLHGRVQLSEVWLSRDDGATYELVEILEANRRHYDWVVPAVAAPTTARIKIVMWSQNMKRGIGVGEAFTIQPSSFTASARPARRVQTPQTKKQAR